MVCEWGMSEAMGPLTFGKKEPQIFLAREIVKHQDYSEDTALRIDQEVKRIVAANYARAYKILIDHKPVLVRIADELLVREVLDAEQVRRIVAGLPLDDPEPAALVGPASAVPDQEDARRRQKERPSRLPPLPDPLPQE